MEKDNEFEVEEVVLTLPTFQLDWLEGSAEASGATISEYLVTMVGAFMMTGLTHRYRDETPGQDSDGAGCNPAEVGATPTGVSKETPLADFDAPFAARHGEDPERIYDPEAGRWTVRGDNGVYRFEDGV